jgi:hypothetical protein
MATKPIKLTTANFSGSVKSWSYERFMNEFRPLYPGANLEEVAKALGLAPAKGKSEKPKADQE